MGVFSSALECEVRLERMRPEQIDEAMRRCPAIYVPFGSIEWHGRQNAVGLDAIKAHEQLVGLAARIGGVVFPPVFFGSGGGHGDYSHSYMFAPEAMSRIVTDMLHRFQRDGFEAAVLLSGHYPNVNQYIQPAVDAYRSAGGAMRVLAIIENQAPENPGDHAARRETSYMMHLHPETVDLSRLAGHDEDRTGPHQQRNWMGDEFRDHPCYGILGEDPRGNSSAQLGQEMTERLIAHLATWVKGQDAAQA